MQNMNQMGLFVLQKAKYEKELKQAGFSKEEIEEILDVDAVLPKVIATNSNLLDTLKDYSTALYTMGFTDDYSEEDKQKILRNVQILVSETRQFLDELQQVAEVVGSNANMFEQLSFVNKSLLS